MNIHADKIVITYNFTEQPPIKGKHFDNAENIEKQALNPAFSLNLGSHKRENSPPNCGAYNRYAPQFDRGNEDSPRFVRGRSPTLCRGSAGKLLNINRCLILKNML